MKTFSEKSLIVIVSVVLAMVIIYYGIINDVNSPHHKVGSVSKINLVQSTQLHKDSKTIEDPDLQLSIEELRAKYPIDWFDKQFGAYNECATDAPGESYNTSLVCKFTMNKKEIDDELKVEFLNPMEQMSENEIKSILVHYNTKFYGKNRYVDNRLDQILGLLAIQVSKSDRADFKKRSIQSFLYSDTVLDSYKKLSCNTLLKFDSANKHYDRLAVNYIARFYEYRSFESILSSCVYKDRIDIIRKKVSEELESTIKR